MLNATACKEAIENIRALDRRDALRAGRCDYYDTIAALQRDRNVSTRSFIEWELRLGRSASGGVLRSASPAKLRDMSI